MIYFYYLLDINIGDKFLLRPSWPITSGFPTLGSLLTVVLNFILAVGAFLMFLFLIIGGLRYIFSGGDEKATAAARSQITVAVVGFLVLLLSYVIIRLIEFITGLSILSNPSLPT